MRYFEKNIAQSRCRLAMPAKSRHFTERQTVVLNSGKYSRYCYTLRVSLGKAAAITDIVRRSIAQVELARS
jgi:hypothetical protein